MASHPEGSLIGLRSSDGNITLIRIEAGSRKVKGIGILDPLEKFLDADFGSEIQLGRSNYTIVKPRLPDVISGMQRGAQTISAKDAGFFITKLGIGEGDNVLEAGLGSGGLSIHLIRCLGSKGNLISVENREEHASTGMANISSAIEAFSSTASHQCIIGDISEIAQKNVWNLDAIILDLPDHPSAIQALHSSLNHGGRIGCYCPVSSQLEAAWQACEDAGLSIEWAGELMQRQWGRASKGGMRPINGPFGHTAFLLIAYKP